MGSWLPLTDYSIKYKVSVSTLRRRIKTEDLKFRLQDGKYFIIDEPISTHQGEHRPSQDQDATLVGTSMDRKKDRHHRDSHKDGQQEPAASEGGDDEFTTSPKNFLRMSKVGVVSSLSSSQKSAQSSNSHQSNVGDGSNVSNGSNSANGAMSGSGSGRDSNIIPNRDSGRGSNRDSGRELGRDLNRDANRDAIREGHRDSSREEPVLAAANKLLNELKKAYSQILNEKEQHIMQLREEVADLKTLARVLEDENIRLRNLKHT